LVRTLPSKTGKDFVREPCHELNGFPDDVPYTSVLINGVWKIRRLQQATAPFDLSRFVESGNEWKGCSTCRPEELKARQSDVGDHVDEEGEF
tara:strand:- start:1111 stop:1386 length:276 start_codon:yes stop_codon:yes gene_type:complete